ncbi:MAG TPA: hypothetical protein VFJ85_01390 [Acidimicrobiales bacterium]|nr:hypothetical protein [Acidimicrobiales bacterium]
MTVVNETWVRTMTLTTVTLTQQPLAPALGDHDLADWLATGAVKAITDAPPWPIAAAAAVVPVPESDRTRAEELAALQHAAGVPGREAGDGVSTWRHLVVQVAFPPAVAPIEDLVTHVHRAITSMAPPAPWRATLQAATLPLPASALPSVERQVSATAWVRSPGL